MNGPKFQQEMHMGQFGNLSRVNSAWSEFKSKQTTKKSNQLKTVKNFLPGKSVACQMEKDWEKKTLSHVMIGEISFLSGTTFIFSLLSSNIQKKTSFFFQIHLGSIGSWNLKWINCTLQIYHWYYSFLCAKSSSTIVVCSKRDVWWLISALNAVHLASLPA